MSDILRMVIDRTKTLMPVRINNQDFTFSPGRHNELQKAIIETWIAEPPDYMIHLNGDKFLGSRV